jgi:hypothetical protein
MFLRNLVQISGLYNAISEKITLHNKRCKDLTSYMYIEKKEFTFERTNELEKCHECGHKVSISNWPHGAVRI